MFSPWSPEYQSLYHPFTTYPRSIMDPERDSLDMWSFQKLTSDNYYTWSKHMKAALQSRQLWWGYVEREGPPPKPPVKPPKPGSTVLDPIAPSESPEDPQAASGCVAVVTDETGEAEEVEAASLDDNEDFDMYSLAYTKWERDRDRYKNWMLKDHAAMGSMKLAMEPSQWHHVRAATTSKEMWDTLYQWYFASSRAMNLNHYTWDLLHQRWDERTTSMSQHIRYMLNLRQRVVDYGGHFDDDMLIHAIFSTLPPTRNWWLLRNALFRRGDALTLGDTITELNAEFGRMQQNEVVGGHGKSGSSGQRRERGIGGGAKKHKKKSRRHPK